MTVAQGINKILSYKAQSGLGSPASGASGYQLRRKTSVPTRNRASFVNDEIVSHQQGTGVNLGTSSTGWSFDGLLSCQTYKDFIAALLRKVFTTTTAITGLTLTIAGSGPFTITRSSGSFLTGGIKIGDVVRITAGTFTNPVNRDNNVLVTGLTATIITGITLNGTTLLGETGSALDNTLAVVGKKSIAPLTGQTDTLFTIEEWFSDITKSFTYPDMRIGQMDLSLPASGNGDIKFTGMGLGVRTIGSSQVLTNPTAATTSGVLTAVRGVLLVNGVQQLGVTGLTISVKGNLTPEGPVVGSNYPPDASRGRIEVSGQFQALLDGTVLSTLFDNETSIGLIGVFTEDVTNASNFMTVSMSSIKLTGDNADDGEKPITRTYPFVAGINMAGGPTLANDQTIISIQDSLA